VFANPRRPWKTADREKTRDAFTRADKKNDDFLNTLDLDRTPLRGSFVHAGRDEAEKARDGEQAFTSRTVFVAGVARVGLVTEKYVAPREAL
jgi:hypothetical protein